MCEANLKGNTMYLQKKGPLIGFKFRRRERKKKIQEQEVELDQIKKIECKCFCILKDFEKYLVSKALKYLSNEELVQGVA